MMSVQRRRGGRYRWSSGLIAGVVVQSCFFITASAGGLNQAAKPLGAKIDESHLERRTRAVTCMGTSTKLEGVLLRVEDVAVQGLGCKVTIKNSRIVATVALQFAGNSDVTIENSIIEGTVAFQMSDEAVATVQSSTIRGSVQKLGNAKVRDLGENLWR